jgi:hypothetical protein
MPVAMRAYHFLSADNALKDLTNRHLKISEIDKLNDPFELWCTAQTDRDLRRGLRNWKAQMAQQYGMLCFTRRWRNPVLWSHYADQHRGMCLGFDVPRESLRPVAYVTKRLPLRLPLTPATTEELLFTKYRDWQYEEEWRGWFRLEECDPITGFYFCKLDDKIRLREVIVGPLCDTLKPRIEVALTGYRRDVRILKARLAFTSFRVVKNRQGFQRGASFGAKDGTKSPPEKE